MTLAPLTLLLTLALAPGDLSDHEATRLSLLGTLRGGAADGIVERARDAELLAASVTADPEAPEWYAAEVVDLAASFGAIAALEPADRERLADALASGRPRSIGDLRASVATVEELLGSDHALVASQLVVLSRGERSAGGLRESADSAARALRLAEGWEDPRPATRAALARWFGDCLLWLGAGQDAARVLAETAAEWERLDALALRVFVMDAADTINLASSAFDALLSFDEAERYSRRFVDVAEEVFGPHSSDYYIALHNLGVHFDRRGLGHRALPLLQESLAGKLRLYGSGHSDVAYGWLALGSSYLAQGRAAEAEGCLEEALRGFEDAGLAHESMWARMRLSESYTALRRFEAAVAAAERAASEAGRLLADAPVDYSVILGALGSALLDGDDHERAGEVLEEVLRLRESALGPDAPYVGYAVYQLGNLYEQTGRIDEAVPLYERAAELAEALGPPGDYLASEAHWGLGRALFRDGDLEGAEALLSTAAERWERMRAGQVREHGMLQFLRTPLPDLAHLRRLLGRGREAWQTDERYRSRLLLECLTASGRGNEDRRAIDTEVERLEAQLAALEGEVGGSDERVVETASRLLAARADKQRAAAAESAHEPYSLERVRASLAPDEAMIGWSIGVGIGGDAWLRAWCLRSEGTVRWFETRLPDDEMEGVVWTRVSELGATLAAEARSPFAPRAASIRGEASALGEGFFAMLDEAGVLEGASHLVIVPTFEMPNAPLDALVVGDDWLEERFTLSYAPSASIHAYLRELAPRASDEDGGARSSWATRPSRPSTWSRWARSTRARTRGRRPCAA